MTGPILDVAGREVPDGERAWVPFPGFQERALAASSDEVFCGGAKGPGKTDLLVVKPLYWVGREAFAGLFLRETFPELARPLDRATRLYAKMPAGDRPVWNGEKQRFTFPSRAFIQFGYCRTKEDLTRYQGGNWAGIYYDELGNQPDERVIDGLLSEMRCPDPAIKRQFMGSGNPGFAGHPMIKRRYIVPCGKDGGVSWVSTRLLDGSVRWWSREFVPGRVTDNPIYANDPTYMAQLMMLPDRLRRCLLDGDWDASTGVALDELDAGRHMVKPFEVPSDWPYVAAFDWGYSHWAVFMWGRVSEDGRVYVCDTIKRRLLRDWDLAATYNELVPPQALRVVNAGHDCWHVLRARGENAPQTAEYFGQCGIGLVRANTDRVSGYNNMLRYMGWRQTDFVPERKPMVQFFDTPGNRWLVEEHLPMMVVDPDDPRDVLKVNTDAETGLGGDDGYDCLRYLLASRPLKADEGERDALYRSAWDADVLRQEAERFGRVDTRTESRKVNKFYKGV